MPIYTFIALLAGAIFAASGQVLFKIGASGRESLTDFINLWIFGGLVLYGIGTVLWIFSLSKVNLLIVYPFTALTFILVYLSGIFIFNEPTSIKALFGVSLILLGLLLITLG